MQDLVQMMTQTLRMDARDGLSEQENSRGNSAMLPEFKLNRKYRDTLMLHGKSRERECDFHVSDVRSGSVHKLSFYKNRSDHKSDFFNVYDLCGDLDLDLDLVLA